MKKEFKKHIFPLVIILLVTSLFWIFNKVPYYEFIFLFFGLAIGSLFLDLDHIIYWFYLKPNLDESREAREHFQNRNFKLFFKLLVDTKEKHVNLVFHHYFSQIVLALISFFVFTSSNSIFAMAFILALNIHLLIDEYYDYLSDPKYLQSWLFAREQKQLPVTHLKNYLIVFSIICLFFTFLLIRSVL